MRFAIAIICLAAGLIAASTSVASEPLAIPESTLSTLEGAPLSTRSIGVPGKWLLLYVAPDSVHSQTLLGLFKHLPPEYNSEKRVVVVVHARPEDAMLMKKLFPALADSAWYADPTGSLERVADIRDVPMSFAIKRDTIIAWRFAGVPIEVTNFRQILTDWLKVPANVPLVGSSAAK